MMLTQTLQVQEVMHRSFPQVRPDVSIREARQVLQEAGEGPLPVVDKGRLIGMVTASGIALAPDPAQPVSVVMTPSVIFCYADQNVEEARRTMEEFHVHQLLVLGRDRQVTGVLSEADLVSL